MFTYTYNQLNRLIRVEQGAATVAEYAYDPFGRRVKKTVSGTTTHFHYDLQSRLIAETGGDGTPLRDYVYQNGRLIAIKLHGAQAGVYYVISDHLGTPQQIVDSTGAVVWKAAFLPFGEAQILTEIITNNIRFPGQYFDAETGLHYNWNRYYDPDTGRYLTPDPIGLAGGMNLFAYVAGDPVNFVDPMGLCIWDACIGEGAYIGLAAGTAAAGWLASPQGQKALGKAFGWMMNEEDDECIEPGPDHPYNPGQPTEKDGFKPPKNSNGKKTKKNGQWGWADKNGNHWVPINPGNAHGGPHWDVQKPGGGYVNVSPGGRVR